MTRRSPYKHPVKSHTRSGSQVSNYERGKGRRPANPTAKRAGKAAQGWRVTAYYPGGSDSRPLRAGTMTEAVMQGLPMLSLPETPTRVRVRRLTS